MLERIRGSYDNALYKSTHTLLYIINIIVIIIIVVSKYCTNYSVYSN